MHPRNIKCPKCGHVFRVVYYTSINSWMDPELLQRFIDDELYYFKCEKCGKVIHVDTWVIINCSKGMFTISSGDNLDEIKEKLKKMGVVDENDKVTDSFFSFNRQENEGIVQKRIEEFEKSKKELFDDLKSISKKINEDEDSKVDSSKEPDSND